MAVDPTLEETDQNRQQELEAQIKSIKSFLKHMGKCPQEARECSKDAIKQNEIQLEDLKNKFKGTRPVQAQLQSVLQRKKALKESFTKSSKAIEAAEMELKRVKAAHEELESKLKEVEKELANITEKVTTEVMPPPPAAGNLEAELKDFLEKTTDERKKQLTEAINLIQEARKEAKDEGKEDDTGTKRSAGANQQPPAKQAKM